MAAKKSKTKAPSKKPTPKTTLNKSAFIRANPSLGTAELVEKAKKAGLELSTAYVYTLRSSDKAKGAPKASSKVKTSSGGDIGNRRAQTKAEQELVDLVLEHGAGPVRGMLDSIVAKLKASVR